MDTAATLKAFLRKRRNESIAEKTLLDDEEVIKKFLVFIGNRELTDEAVFDYLDYIRKYTFIRKGKQCHYSKYSIYQKESKIKKFLSFAKPELCDCIKPRMPKNRKLPEDLLTDEDIEKLLNACQTLRDKAMVAFLFESGCRKGEMLSIKIRNVAFDSMGAAVTIPSGKTGSRRIRVVYCAAFLRQYIENHPNTDTDSPLFCSTRSPYNKISDSGLKEQLKELAKRAGIKKNIFPHLLRHSRATRLAEHLTEAQLSKYLGWSNGSSMPSVYVHLSGRDIDNAILKMNGVEIEGTYTQSFKVGRCPRCHDLNPEEASFCNKCGLPLRDEVRDKLEKDMAEIDLTLMKAIAVNPNIVKILAEEVNKLQNNKKEDRL